MPMTTHTSKSKPKVEFQYSSRSFSETASSFISAVDWDRPRAYLIEIWYANRDILSNLVWK